MACNYFQVFIITVVSARITVGYDRTATKTYEVQVPGSSPIRIIEADPMWHRDGYYYSPSPPPDVEHRSLSTEKIWKTQSDKKKNSFTTQQTKTTLNEPFSGVNELSVASTTLHNPVTNLNEPITNKPKCYGSMCDDENKNVETSVDEEQFKNILKQYAENIKRPIDMPKNENEKRDFSSSSENFEKFLKMFVEKSQTSNDLQRKNGEQDSRYFDKMLKVYTEQFEKPTDNNGFQRKKMDLLSSDHDLNDRQANLDKFLKQFTETINNNENNDFHEKKLERVELFTREKHHNKEDEEDEKHKKTILRIELLQKEDETKKDRETTEKDGKSVWNLMDTKYHKHPYDDRDGWVTLDAVPWSSSKISKWQSNAKPHWSNDDGYKPSRPSYDSNRPGSYDSYKPTGFVTARPSYDFNRPNFESNRPTYENNRPNYEAVRPAGGYNDRYGDERPWPVEVPQKRPPWIKDPYEDNRHGTLSQNYQQEIITDGLPGNFPAASYNNYNIETLNGNSNHKPTSVVYADISTGRPFTHPENGDGEWVLLSTTKGYQYPRNRQRALKIRPDALTSRRSIRLTVLPGDPSNTTTSHGGLLEVESTFETVDEARTQYVRNQNKFNRTTKPFRPQRPNKAMKLPHTTTQPASAHSDPTAVLAAVGAGLVPATMAMLVPLALGRRRRSVSGSKDNVRTYVLHRNPLM